MKVVSMARHLPHIDVSDVRGLHRRPRFSPDRSNPFPHPLPGPSRFPVGAETPPPGQSRTPADPGTRPQPAQEHQCPLSSPVARRSSGAGQPPSGPTCARRRDSSAGSSRTRQRPPANAFETLCGRLRNREQRRGRFITESKAHEGFRACLKRMASCSIPVRWSHGPVSLADACVVRMAEMHPRSVICTIDSDFSIYRKAVRHPLNLLTLRR